MRVGPCSIHAAGDRERCTKCLPIVARNVETLFLMSAEEIGAFYGLNDLPQEKFFHLKYLELACKVAIVGPKTVISLTIDTCFWSLFSSIVQHWKLLSAGMTYFISHSFFLSFQLFGSSLYDNL